MKRKIVKQGQATMTVSLPSKWIKKNNLNSGDEINIEEKDSNLILSGKNASFEESIKVDLSDKSERIVRWALSGLHKKGYDEIEVIINNPKTITIIEDLVKNLFTGFVIMDQSSKRCVLKSISKDTDSDFDNILRRAFLVCLSIADNSLESIKNNNMEELRSFLSLEKTNNQLTNFCERLINKGIYKDSKNSHFMYVIAWNLEKVCDDYKEICEYLSDNKTKIDKKSIDTYENVNKILRKYYELFFKFDFKVLQDINKEANNIIKSFENKELSKVEFYLLSTVYKIKDFSASTIALNT